VCASGKRWQAKIYYIGKEHRLGTFDTKQEAALAYDMAARQRKEEKSLNFESIEAGEEAAAEAQAEMFADALCAGPLRRSHGQHRATSSGGGSSRACLVLGAFVGCFSLKHKELSSKQKTKGTQLKKLKTK
jgi:hypothetical protein